MLDRCDDDGKEWSGKQLIKIFLPDEYIISFLFWLVT